MPKQFLEELFKEESEHNNSVNVYAVIDAARIKKLTNELIVVDEKKQQILFDGKDAIELEEVAPYLIELKKEDEFTQWVAKNVYGNNGAIFIKTTNDIETLAQHLKKFIHVTREVEHEGELVTQKGYLAYYDPRVFPNWIESETTQRQTEFFSNIKEVLCEDEFKQNYYLSYQYNNELTAQSKQAYEVNQ